MRFLHAISCLNKRIKLKPIIKKALKAGFDGLEIGLDGHKWPNQIRKSEKKELLKLKTSIHLPFNFILFPSGNEILIVEDSKKPKSFIKIMDSCIKFANEINARYVVFHPILNMVNIAEFSDFFVAIEICDFIIEKYSKLCNSPFCIENVFPSWVDEFEAMKRFLKNKNTKVCFDIAINELANVEENKKSNWKKWLNEFKGKTQAYHLSDIIALPDGYMHHIKISNGELNFKKYLNYLKNLNPKNITFEEIYKNILIFEEKKKIKIRTERMTWQDRKESLDFVKSILLPKKLKK